MKWTEWRASQMSQEKGRGVNREGENEWLLSSSHIKPTSVICTPSPTQKPLHADANCSCISHRQTHLQRSPHTRALKGGITGHLTIFSLEASLISKSLLTSLLCLWMEGGPLQLCRFCNKKMKGKTKSYWLSHQTTYLYHLLLRIRY